MKMKSEDAAATGSHPFGSADGFTEEAELLRLLGHPVRLRILRGLLHSAACVKDIWHCMDMPQATVSQHLAVLRAHGVIRGEREGTTVTYRVVHPFVREFVTWLGKSRSDNSKGA